MILGGSILIGLYLLSMIALIIGFRKLPVFNTPDSRPITQFSVIIPFRNEAQNLPFLLKSLSLLEYPSHLFEIIFIDDASKDISQNLIVEAMEHSNISIKLLQNRRISNSPKKDAIIVGITHAKSDWIVTTDADCEVSKTWLKVLDAFIQAYNTTPSTPVMVCGPVVHKSEGKLIETFQTIDGLSLQSVTMGSFGLDIPFLNNGANTAYTKKAFKAVGGFSGNDHIASGDDVFLMEKMRDAYPDRLRFLKSKDFAVTTQSLPTSAQVINQRVRWASKTAHLSNPVVIPLGLLVFLTNLAVLAIPFLIVFAPGQWMSFMIFLASKIIVDFLVVRQAASLFEIKMPFWRFLVFPLLYAAVTVVVPLLSIRGKYIWKGRKY